MKGKWNGLAGRCDQTGPQLESPYGGCQPHDSRDPGVSCETRTRVRTPERGGARTVLEIEIMCETTVRLTRRVDARRGVVSNAERGGKPLMRTKAH